MRNNLTGQGTPLAASRWGVVSSGELRRMAGERCLSPRSRKRRASVVALVLLLASSPAFADKSQFTLLNPTPRDQMRAMSTDRPDTTESPITVDAGHWQLELSFAEYAVDGDSKSFAAVPFNLKLGLTNSIDLQLLFDPFINREGPHASGVGDFTVRTKINLWGNDEGSTALGLMPFVTFPTSTGDVGSDDVEGGLIIPFAMDLPGEWGLGLMVEFDLVRDEDDDGYTVDLVHSAVLGHDIVGDLGGYIEYVGVAPHNSGGGYQAYLSTGLTYGVNDDVQLDGGVRIGLSDSAEDFGLFVGMAFRH